MDHSIVFDEFPWGTLARCERCGAFRPHDLQAGRECLGEGRAVARYPHGLRRRWTAEERRNVVRPKADENGAFLDVTRVAARMPWPGASCDIPSEETPAIQRPTLRKVRAVAENGGGVIHGADQGAPNIKGRKGTLRIIDDGFPLVALDPAYLDAKSEVDWVLAVTCALSYLNLVDASLQLNKATAQQRFAALFSGSDDWLECVRRFGAPEEIDSVCLRYGSKRQGFASGGGNVEGATQPHLISPLKRQTIEKRLRKNPGWLKADLAELVAEDAVHGWPTVVPDERIPVLPVLRDQLGELGRKADILEEFAGVSMRAWVDMKSKTVGEDQPLDARVEREHDADDAKLTLLLDGGQKTRLTRAEWREFKLLRAEVHRVLEESGAGLRESKDEAKGGDYAGRAKRSGMHRIFADDARWQEETRRFDLIGRDDEGHLPPHVLAARPWPPKKLPMPESACLPVAAQPTLTGEQQTRAPQTRTGLVTETQVSEVEVAHELRSTGCDPKPTNCRVGIPGNDAPRRARHRAVVPADETHDREDRSALAGAGSDLAACKDSA